jgi:hypothetical protein
MNEVNWVIHSSNSSKSGSDIDEADDIEVVYSFDGIVQLSEILS